MKRKGFFLLLTLCMLASLLPAGALAATFRDVAQGAWYAGDVADIQQYGLINGHPDGTFRPKEKLSLAQAITLATRTHVQLYGGSELKNGSPWYQSYVDYADRNGICSEGEFGTDYNGECSRLTMAVLFQRVFPEDTEKAMNIVRSLPDVIDSGYGSSVFYLYREGVLTGNDDQGTFKPDKSISRAEAAAILNRVMNPEKRKSFFLRSQTEATDPEEIFRRFFASGAFLQDAEDWMEPLEAADFEYRLIDLDQNGVPEMILEGHEGYGFYYSTVYYLDGSTVRKAEDGVFYSFYGLNYAEDRADFWRCDYYFFEGNGDFEFYRYEAGRVIFEFSLHIETPPSGGAPKRYIAYPDGTEWVLTEEQFSAMFDLQMDRDDDGDWMNQD